TIQVSDGTGTVFQSVDIDIGDENDTAPAGIAGQVFTVAENAANGASLGTTVATDVDTVGTLQGWTIVSGNSDGIFAIDSVTGELTVTDNSNLDFETTTDYALGIKVEDGVNASSIQTITILVGDVNESPSIGAIPN